MTALPKLHPAVVHFPIALLPLALGFEIAGLVSARTEWLRSAATTVYSLAAVTAAVAVWAGRRAADGLVGVPPRVQPRIGEHSDWAHYALYLLLAVAAIRLFVHLRPSLGAHTGARCTVLVLGLAALGLVAVAADHGGALVYEHGVGVRAPIEQEVGAESDAEEAMAVAAKDSASDRLIARNDGALEWRPLSGDGPALSSFFRAIPDEGFEHLIPLDDEGEGLTVSVHEPITLLFPEAFGDVQVEAEIEWLDFEGSVAVVHHAAGDDAGWFSLSNEGDAVLVDRREGEEKELDRQRAEVPGQRFTIAVSSAGRHLKGLIDGRTVTHGHIAAGADGSCGLRLNGTGTIRIVRVLVQPLA